MSLDLNSQLLHRTMWDSFVILLGRHMRVLALKFGEEKAELRSVNEKLFKRRQ